MAGAEGDLSFEVLSGEAIGPILDDLARLRITVFRAYPYLYDGDADYERAYLASYAKSHGAMAVIARTGAGEIVGAATAAPLGDHQPQLSEAFREKGIDPAEVFYLGESVLLADYRGQGAGHRFFDAREQAGRAGGYRIAAFCGVVRPDDKKNEEKSSPEKAGAAGGSDSTQKPESDTYSNSLQDDLVRYHHAIGRRALVEPNMHEYATDLVLFQFCYPIVSKNDYWSGPLDIRHNDTFEDTSLKDLSETRAQQEFDFAQGTTQLHTLK